MRLFKIIFSLSAMFLLGSCNGFLDTKIDTNLTPENLETNRSTLWNFAAAFYTPMQYGFETLDYNLFAPASDEAMQTAATGGIQYFNKGIVNADVNPMSYLYEKYYNGIRAANFFLDYAKNGENLLRLNRDTVRDNNDYRRDLESLNWYRAEAQIAKAYYYSELIKMYGDVPIVNYTLENDPNKGKVPQTPYNQVVDYILGLIDANLDKLKSDWISDDGFADQAGRFDRNAALALKARTLLYAASPLNNPTNDLQKWEKAAKAAHDLMEAKNYTLPEERDYYNAFIGNNPVESREAIFIIRQNANNGMEKNNYPIATPGGNSGVTPSHNLVSAYEYIGAPDPANPYANRDPRLQATVVVNGSTWNGREIKQAAGESDDMSRANTSKTGYYLKKFLTDELNLIQGATAQHQWIVYRYAEVLLNYAEAMNEAYGADAQPTGYTLSARDALNEVRKSASLSLPAVTAVSKDDFRKAVKHERRVELAFEDHRYWDLLRWKDAATVLNEPITGVKITKNVGGTYQYQVKNVGTRVFAERNYRFPYTRTEIVNSNGTLKQNTGY